MTEPRRKILIPSFSFEPVSDQNLSELAKEHAEQRDKEEQELLCRLLDAEWLELCDYLADMLEPAPGHKTAEETQQLLDEVVAMQTALRQKYGIEQEKDGTP